MKQKNLLIGLITLASFFMAGCSMHQKRVLEISDLPAGYGQEENCDNQSISTDAWWKSFNDHELNQLMRQAFAQNLDLEIYLSRLEQAGALSRLRNASFWPTMDIGGAGGKEHYTILGDETTNTTYSASLAASYEVDLWGKLKAQRESGRAVQIAAEEDVYTFYLSLAAQIAETYYQVIEARAKNALNNEIIASFQETNDLVAQLYKHGVAPALDLYQAQQNLLSAQAAHPLLQAEITTSMNQLSILLGHFPNEQSFGSLVALPDLNHSFTQGLTTDLLQNRPDVKAAFQRLQAADADVAAAIANRFPTIQLTGSYTGTSNDFNNILNSANIFWNLLGGVTMPIIDGGRRRAVVAGRKAQFREKSAVYRKTVLKAFQEVEDALIQERAVDKQISIVLKREEVTKTTLELSLAKYNLGLTDFLQVLSAQSSHANASIAVISARRQRISSRIQLARALGGEWMRDELSSRITHDQ